MLTLALFNVFKHQLAFCNLKEFRYSLRYSLDFRDIVFTVFKDFRGFGNILHHIVLKWGI